MKNLRNPISILLAMLIILSAITLAPVSAAAAEDYKTTTSLKAGQTADIRTNADVKSWSSSNKSVATVKNGTVTALTKGTAIISVTLKNGNVDKHKITVTTNPKIVGKKKKAEKYFTFKIGVEGAATGVQYSSSKPKVASITSRGEITTLKVGKTTISAKVNGTTLSFTLQVYIKDIVNRYKRTLKKGTTNWLYFSEVGKNPKIVSKNPKIVKVIKGGKLKALKRGKTTVTFTQKHAKAIVTVKVV